MSSQSLTRKVREGGLVAHKAGAGDTPGHPGGGVGAESCPESRGGAEELRGHGEGVEVRLDSIELRCEVQTDSQDVIQLLGGRNSKI